MGTNINTALLLLPELILVLMAAWLYIGGTLARSRSGWTSFAVATLLVSFAAIVRHYLKLDEKGYFGDAGAHGFSGPLSIDAFGFGMRTLSLGIGVLLVLIASRTGEEALSSEMLGTILMLVAGLMIVGAAQDLVLLFLGMEMVSIPTYILLFLGRKGRGNSEATAKYFFLSILSSAILLYGFSFLYGIAGSTNLTDIHATLSAAPLLADSEGIASLATPALALIFAGLGFKIAAVPFHFYAPDVYQGTSSFNAGLLSVAPKVVGVIALVRVVYAAMPGQEQFAWQLALALSVLTMTVGNVAALWQKNVRRMMAYSAIAHAGYLLIGLAVALAATSVPNSGETEGIKAMLFYLVVYSVATLGVFASLTYLGGTGRDIETVDDLSGAAKQHPIAAATIAVFMFSLAGLPPLAGFWGKLSLLLGSVGLSQQLLNQSGGMAAGISPTAYWFVGLAVIGVINAAISAAYYLRIVGVMYFGEAKEKLPAAGGRSAWSAAVICGLLVIGLGVLPGPLMQWMRKSEASARLSIEPARPMAAQAANGFQSPISDR